MFTRLISLCLLLTLLLTAACQPVLPVTPEATVAPAAEVDAADDSLRTITDASGQEVEVPVAPQRVVTLSEQDLDGALALGLTPVGTVNGRGQATPPLYLGERIAGIESVGNLAEPSLEKIVELQPDLILVGGIFPALEELLPELNQIAPTVVTYAIDEDWKSAFLGTADALNLESEAQEFLAAYDARLGDSGQVGANANAEVSIVRWNPQGPGIMALDSFASLIVRDLGLVRPATQQIEGFAHSEPLSLEQLDQIDADWLFLGTLNPEGEAAMVDAQSSPLYQQLAVVQNEHVVMVDGTVWTSRGGPLAAQVGDLVGIAGPGTRGPIPHDADWYFFTGDASALPAMSAHLEQLPATARGVAYIEVEDASEKQELVRPAGVTLTWLFRNGRAPEQSTLIIDAVREEEWPAGKVIFWIAGEAISVAAVRHYARVERGLERSQVDAIPYWKAGVGEETYHDERHKVMDEDEE